MKHARSLLLLSLASVVACSGDDPPGLTCPVGTLAVNGVCVDDKSDGGQVVDSDSGVLPPRDGGNDPIDAGMNAATISTAEISFGRVVVGESQSADSVITNNTSEPLTIKVGTVVQTTEIAMTATSSIPPDGLMLAVGASVTLTFTYTPVTVGAQQGAVEVELCTNDCVGMITIGGEGIREAIVCQPPTLDFGFVNPGDCLTLAEDCFNDSSYPADIVSGTLSGSSSPAYTVTGTAALPVTLAPGDNATFDVTYCPTDFVQDSGVLILDVTHPDPMQRSKRVGLVGVGGGPDIECTGMADFGIIGTGQTATRNLNCTNTGADPLTISAGAFAAGTTAELTAELFAAGSTVALAFPVVLQATEGVDIALTYRPLAPAMHTTTYDVTSDDRDTPTVTIPVEAQAIDSAGCEVRAIPAANVEMGSVAPGATADVDVRVVNIGTGMCAVTTIGFTGQSDGEFTVAGQMSGILGTGDTLITVVTFAPTMEAAFTGTLEFQTSDPVNPILPVTVSGTGLVPFGTVQVTPTVMDFGTVGTACANAPERPFTITNFTGSAATVTVSLEPGSSPDFSIVTSPTTFVIPDGGNADVVIAFAPTLMRRITARIRVDVMGLPPTIVTAFGAAGANSINTDTFAGVTPGVRDILFIVDDSCSMQAEQNRLATVAPIFIERGDASGHDYHMAIATTDPNANVRGTIRGNPAVIDWMSPTRTADLVTNIQQGIQGSGNEQGLRGAAEATTNQALLNGTNAGFLRPDGELTVIIISDEEDNSPGPVTNYLGAMATRPIGVLGSLRVFTITGGLNGCQGAGTTAQASQRYPAAASQSGGFDASICAEQYAQVITGIADQTFGLVRDTFQLGSTPAPAMGSVRVEVNGMIVPADTGTVANWGVDYGRSTVVFAPGRAPPATANVSITYSGVCVAATCGDALPNTGEQCDDGNAVNTDACIDTCYDASCGDGFVQAGVEQCDDGNTIVGDGCNFLCNTEVCGNGILEPPEVCDFGTGNSDTLPNACRVACVNPACGDSVTDTGEACDDGNADNTDGCIDTCVAASCGDGFVQAGVEDCDDQNNDPTDLCDQCQFTFGTFTVTSTPSTPLVPQQNGTALTFTPNLDDGLATVAIGFPFDYLGTPVTDALVGTNGFVAFETTGTASGNVTIPNVAAPNSMVAWWWDDLDIRTPLTPAAVTTTSLVGTAPNRVRIFTMLNIPRYRGNTPFPNRGVLLNAEIRLYEGSNIVEVHYGALGQSGPGLNNFGATVGYETQGGLFGQDVLGCGNTCNRQQWPTDTVFAYTP